MSRVRDALKRANAMTPSAETEAISEVFGVGAETEDTAEVSAPLHFSAEPLSLPDDCHPRLQPLLRYRWLRKLLRVAGVRTKIAVQRCQGTTRMGQPCRGPAMANGYCRLHGGSRRGVVAQKTRDLIERVLPAR
jgi:hypothetical protein